MDSEHQLLKIPTSRRVRLHYFEQGAAKFEKGVAEEAEQRRRGKEKMALFVLVIESLSHISTCCCYGKWADAGCNAVRSSLIADAFLGGSTEKRKRKHKEPFHFKSAFSNRESIDLVIGLSVD
ncbi:uncharacterized protein MONOS_11817 [Monocercomonoides exilis]|uniref:uncharacterized protein n=1 Tax=Monocercomonoides exilis TaxID=2049356 RepID=UPI003559BE8D|nr:hypothetical protein MONOS_11817 [Monocercomonoides exilis]|eukprot:MONOS_11817.1-p1 / transcript=MONOS_11817.1 / gene=MONOS_11817 / organism=Monocercomonoides_exilis_PA203 / gene_product=unspecified product / transcript_product=unspecified product / location=Mono_scaffold00615:13465-14119(+) / protein_length=123 / sequence_SO=supercontig / SO=protein_coding / is_pseudo=false